MAPLASLRSLWRLERRRKLALMLSGLLTGEIICRGAALLIALRVDPADLRERIAAVPPGIRDAWPAISHVAAGIEIALVLLIGAYALVALSLQLWWQFSTWPRAREQRAKPGRLLEIMPATDSTVRFPAMESLLGQVFALLQADRGTVRRGEATTLALEYWSDQAGTRLLCWLPGDTDERLLGAFAEQLRAAYPGVRLRQAEDPLCSTLLAAQGQRETVLGVCEYGLRAHSDYPLRDPQSFNSDPLAGLVAVLQTDATTPLVGLQIVLTAYNGAWRDDVARRIELLRARELTAQRKAALPATHAAEVRAFGRQSDQLGFDTLVRAVALASGAGADKAVEERLDRITRQLTQYDATLGAIRQGLAPTLRQRDHPAATRPANQILRLLRGARARWNTFSGQNAGNNAEIQQPHNAKPAAADATNSADSGGGTALPDWVRAALDRRPRRLDPLGRRLHVLGARELATLWHLPTKELTKLPGLNCWQRAQVFPAPPGVRVPGGEAARDWLITGIAPRELGTPNGPPQYTGLRRAALNQHVYVNGPTRSGKTKLLENLTCQDLEGGWGVGVIDPKGDYARKTILMVPWEREGEVCYFDPLDTTRRIMGVNPLERLAVQRLGRDVVQSGAVGILGSLGAGWEQAPLGKRFMQHALALLLDAEPEPTFLHLYKLLQHSKEGNPYRDELLARANAATAQNYSVVAADFWANQVPGMKETQLNSLQTALTRTESFLANERVLQMVAQPASTFNLRKMMDGKGIFVAAVTAELGGDLQRFVGTLLMTLVTQAGFSRNDLREGEREFWRLTVDEFQKFIAISGSAEAFEDLLSMLGGLGVGLTMAHQAFKQLDPDLLGVILGNAGTRIFYPSQEDAAAVARRLGGQVRREDQLYLERFWTTQVLPMTSGSSGPVTVAPLPIAPVAAHPTYVRAVPQEVLADPVVRCWRRGRVPVDELPSGALRDLAMAWPGEDDHERRVRLSGLAEALYGAERDEQVVPVLCSLVDEDFQLYCWLRRRADEYLRERILAHPRLVGSQLNEETKLQRIALLSDLLYGTPPVEVKAQIARVMGLAAVSQDTKSPQLDKDPELRIELTNAGSDAGPQLDKDTLAGGIAETAAAGRSETPATDEDKDQAPPLDVDEQPHDAMVPVERTAANVESPVRAADAAGAARASVNLVKLWLVSVKGGAPPAKSNGHAAGASAQRGDHPCATSTTAPPHAGGEQRRSEQPSRVAPAGNPILPPAPATSSAAAESPVIPAAEQATASAADTASGQGGAGAQHMFAAETPAAPAGVGSLQAPLLDTAEPPGRAGRHTIDASGVDLHNDAITDTAAHDGFALPLD